MCTYITYACIKIRTCAVSMVNMQYKRQKSIKTNVDYFVTNVYFVRYGMYSILYDQGAPSDQIGTVMTSSTITHSESSVDSGVSFRLR